MMQIKVINNCAIVIIKNLSNFFVCIFIQDNISISLDLFIKKIGFTFYPKQFAVSRVIRIELFNLSLITKLNKEEINNELFPFFSDLFQKNQK